jgi:hypothetical protein
VFRDRVFRILQPRELKEAQTGANPIAKQFNLMEQMIRAFRQQREMSFFGLQSFPSARFFPKKTGRIAAFGPSGDKKIALLQPAFLEFHVTP